MITYTFAPDGDDEPTMWKTDSRKSDAVPSGWTVEPVAVLRRSENPEAFDLLQKRLVPKPAVVDPDKWGPWLQEAEDLDETLARFATWLFAPADDETADQISRLSAGGGSPASLARDLAEIWLKADQEHDLYGPFDDELRERPER